MVPRSISGTPKRRQKMPKVASSATTRMSAHSASSIPPATAKPSTAAITGFDRRRRLGPIGAIESWPPISRFLLGSPEATALRSAPAQKVPPVPVNTATDATASASKALNASNNFRAVAPSTALRQCGRLMETMVTGPSRSTSTVSVSVMSGAPYCFFGPRSSFRGDAKHRTRNLEIPGLALTRHPGMTGLDCQFGAGDTPIGLQITLAGGVHDAGWQWRRRGFAVPAAGAAFRVEVIAQRLLVEARLRLAGPVGVGGPEPRTVGGHHLVDQDNSSIAVPAEFEFCVGDDDALVAAEFFSKPIDRAAHALQRVRHLVAENLAHARNRDVLVVAGLGLGRRTEDRRLQFCTLEQTRRQLLACQRAGLRVFLPGRAREIAADHAFDRKHLRAPAQHRATGERGAMSLQRRHFIDDGVGIGADHVMRHHALELVEPPGADLGQYRALHRDRFGHDHVEGADAVGGQQQHAVAADGVDIADLAAPDLLQGQVAGEHGGHRSTFKDGAISRDASGRGRYWGQFTPAAE